MAELIEYNKKRNFKKTAEPQGKVKRSKGNLKFLVQKHQASRLHFDFRIEVDGVLKSWAVPKGPPNYSREKHLAMMVEDHPYDYRTFEGTIPEGEYGAGTVMLWDEGTYTTPLTENPEDRNEVEKSLREQIEKGSIKVILTGKKLHGQFALVRFPKAGENAWLMIKDKDEFEGKGFQHENLSVKTGRTLDQIFQGAESKEIEFDSKTVEAESEVDESEIDLQPTKASRVIKPMLATLVDKSFDSKEWIFEIKWDGYRAIANVNKDEVELLSRNTQILNKDFPPIVEDLEKIKEHMVLDGEITVLDENGRSDFQLLQNYKRTGNGNLIYYVFDILEHKKKDLRGLSLVERKKILKKVLPKLPRIKYSDHIEEHGNKFFELAKEKNLEGIIAKLKDSIYTEDVRSETWLKIKHTQQQEVVIGGYTLPEGKRKGFGSLLIGIFRNGEFKYVGHTGSGFNDENLDLIKEKLDKHKTTKSPFVDAPEMKNVAQWIKPKVVCEVKFQGWTESSYMRQAIFLGLREDKKPSEVKKEKSTKITKLVEVKTSDRPGLELIIKNEDKIYWPKEKYTKGDLIDYYEAVSELMLPYQKDRAQNLNRFPNGIDGESFFQKDFDYPPEFARTVKIHSESNDRDIDYLVCDNKETLLYMAGIGCIEINPWNSTVKNLDNPDYLIFDLDADSKHFKKLVKVAQELHKLLEKTEVSSYCKTSGKRGLHVNVPLNAKYTFEQVRSFAEIISTLLEQEFPELVNLDRDPKKRKDMVYIDYLQNRRGQTTASVYSVRPVEGATVSTPLKWSEVNEKLDPKDFTIKTAIKRFDKVGDLWNGILGKGIDLKKALKLIS